MNTYEYVVAVEFDRLLQKQQDEGLSRREDAFLHRALPTMKRLEAEEAVSTRPGRCINDGARVAR